ncbi:hypothetical protein ACQPWW_21510 [Micromonospora sp. CA-240977]|uniref:hypothetical protein n=1 Tax=Micromonospora sp. CA-240977 TaxID=3239957 RepID=UPI003D909AD4
MMASVVIGQFAEYHAAVDDTTGGVRIRRAGPADAPAVLDMRPQPSHATGSRTPDNAHRILVAAGAA